MLSFIWRIIPNKLAERIKKYVYDEVDDSYLEKALEIAKLEGKSEQVESLVWQGWEKSYQLLEKILNTLSGFGGAFFHAIELREFYFRELQMRVGSAKVTRAWIKSALSINLIKCDKDSNGVTRYLVVRETIDMIQEVIIKALEDLI